MWRRMRGDDCISTTAASIFRQFVARSNNLAMKKRSRGRRFKSLLLHISVSRFLEMSENRSKSAVCARFAIARGHRERFARRKSRIWQNLSGRDFARSADHRRKFAWVRNGKCARRVSHRPKPENGMGGSFGTYVKPRRPTACRQAPV
jgi:hypothetical protein